MSIEIVKDTSVVDAEENRYQGVRKHLDQLLQESEKPVLAVAIDGRSGSGKSTLAGWLKEQYDCNIFHMDDFFLQPYQRTEERLAEVGGNVDYERFQTEVLDQLAGWRTEAGVQNEKMKNAGVCSNVFEYQLYSCKVQQLTDRVSVTPKRLNIIEGSYSQNPCFGDCYDLRFFLDISPELQLQRIRERNGEEMLKKFRDIWIPMEEKYFDLFDIRGKSIIVSE